MSALVSLALVLLERSWEILARKHGCRETWTLGGIGKLAITLKH